MKLKNLQLALFSFIAIIFLQSCLPIIRTKSHKQNSITDGLKYGTDGGASFGNSSNGLVNLYYISAGDSGSVFTTTDPVNIPWTARNSGTANNICYLRNLPSYDTSITYGVGENGTIIRSLDQGVTWTVLTPPVSDKLTSIEFTSPFDINILTAVGESGLIIRTTNAGSTWSTVSSGVSKNLNSIFAVSYFNSIIAGDDGTLLRSTNAGANWQNISLADTITDLNKVGNMGTWFFGDIGGIVGDNGTLYFSTNFLIWNPINTGTTRDLFDLKFRSASSGYVAGDSGIIRYTINGGAEWFSDFFLETLTSEKINSTVIVNDTVASGVAGNEIITVHANESLLPVELSAFTYSVRENSVTLFWITSSEINNSGFQIERSYLSSGQSGNWEHAGFVNGNGTTSTASNYTFIDKGLASGAYKYRLKQIDFNGSFEYFYLSGNVIIGVPQHFSLSQNYPNPFNPSTKIKFDIMQDAKAGTSNVSLIVYDAAGKEIQKLVNESLSPGSYEVTWNASHFSSGVYFYKLQSGSFAVTKKMLLTK